MNRTDDKARYGIGIDTGGTYTDAVVIDMHTRHLLKKEKRPTTHYNLSIGIDEVLTAVTDQMDLDRIDTIAFSTTLATNAMLEGRGDSVGLIVIGDVKSFDLPVVSVRYLNGGHDYQGNEAKPLDIDALVDTISQWKSEMGSYAVASTMSIKNPAHELVAQKAIELLDPKPIFLSHEISGLAGIRERAGTAVLHARLMPVIADFIHRLNDITRKKAISARLRMVGGDARPIAFKEAVKRAGRTVASGPAATAMFGARSSAVKEALVVDVGGTSTDMTLIENARPLISENGSRIGPFKTHIDAVDTESVGIGGDSLVRLLRDGTFTVGPDRVLPVARGKVSRNGGNTPWIGAEGRAALFFIEENGLKEDLPDDPLLKVIHKEGPSTIDELSHGLKLSRLTLEQRLSALIFRKKVAALGFTPTDALNVLGKHEVGDPDLSYAAARTLSSARDLSVEAFCKKVIDAACEKIRHAILDMLFRKLNGKGVGGWFPGNENNGKKPLVRVNFTLGIPIVGIGAAAATLLPKVAEDLNTKVIFPAHYTVGNALGAIMIATERKKKDEH